MARQQTRAEAGQLQLEVNENHPPRAHDMPLLYKTWACRSCILTAGTLSSHKLSGPISLKTVNPQVSPHLKETNINDVCDNGVFRALNQAAIAAIGHGR
jgi:hypothetical protein